MQMAMKSALSTPKNEHGGWTGVNLASLGLSGDYSIGFRNTSTGTKSMKQGDVHLK